MSQVGPAWVTLTLDCDCRFAARIQGLLMRVMQTGTFDTAQSVLRFDGQVWRFEKAGEKLIVHEKDERHEFERTGSRTCR